ncbi:MAG: UDP-N-acetylmuramoyl-L-alanyl-D-glutamate--2,6-diaminopimelate ligase [Oscillospiraceae bacterium]|jgi:UDP-N-acetylmuramoyl-L-alanyl-D-glutamate--2,6-diaminopimelate ligase|nr:UDP-N-acetylmuramoyl-L-alanyl-D-glutamate--2,6-diaminopimelate ligase [Oscillospiraceae bacterium]
MRLSALVRGLPGLVGAAGGLDVEISQLITDSRQREPLAGGLFFCVSGAHFDAHAFAPQVIERGAAALVVERILPGVDAPQVQVEDVRSAMSYIAAAYYGYPAQSMIMAGITGTKGKTTSTYLLKAIMEAAGRKSGLIGSTGSLIGETMIASGLTTPDPVDLHRTLRRMADEGVTFCAMEISAHALDMRRLDGLMFDCVAFTNISQDHLDYFGDMDTYWKTKRLAFDACRARRASFNADDEHARGMMEGVSIPYTTYGIREDCDLNARGIEITENGVSFEFVRRGQPIVPVALKLTGMFNAYNSLTAASLALALDVPMETIKAGLESVRAVPGRVEALDTRTPYKVILDYSHAPAALESILCVVREFARRRVIVVFGCGGDRDREKRPVMGEIAGRLADYSILTSDNPRNEDPGEILSAIEYGIKQTRGEYAVIENRREAIRRALEIAREGDVVVLAGKGHETYQEIRGAKKPFDEKIVVRELLEETSGVRGVV